MAGNIHRQKKNRDFVTIDTHCLRNKELRWDAKGLHSYLMQLPDDWKINIADLEKRSLDRHDGTMSPMRALIAAGYVYRERISGEKGRFVGYDYHLFERPQQTVEWLSVNGKTVNGKSTTSKVLKPLSEVSKNEGEGEETPTPAPEFENLEAEKNQSGEVAAGRPVIISSEDLNAVFNQIESDRRKSREDVPDIEDIAETLEDEDAFAQWLPSLHAAQQNKAPGAMPIPTNQFQVTAIASPTDLPGVTIVEAPQKRIEAWEHPNPASPKELKGVLLRYAEQDPDNWRDNVLEAGRATNLPMEKIDECLTDFCAWQFKTDFTKAKLSQYTAAFSLWLKRQRGYDNQPGNQAQVRNGQGQPQENITSKMRQL